VLRACPVQAFDPWVDEMLSVFDLTHEARVVGMGTVVWERVGWLRPGGLRGVDVKELFAMRVLRETYAAILAERQSSAKPRARRGAATKKGAARG
jgi:hypothetical protein